MKAAHSDRQALSACVQWSVVDAWQGCGLGSALLARLSVPDNP